MGHIFNLDVTRSLMSNEFEWTLNKSRDIAIKVKTIISSQRKKIQRNTKQARKVMACPE